MQNFPDNPKLFIQFPIQKFTGYTLEPHAAIVKEMCI